MVDVLVVGGGLAGALTALHLTQGGARVALSRGGWGATAAFSGAFDLALSPALSALGSGAPHGQETAAAHVAPWGLRKHLDDIVGHEPLHPFSIMGPEAVLEDMQRSFALLQEQVLDAAQLAASPIDADTPCTLWPSISGTLTPATAYLQSEFNAPGTPFAVADAAIGAAGSQTATWGVLNLAASDVHMGPRVLAGWMHDAEQFGALAPHLKQVLANAADIGMYSGAFHLARHLDDLGHAQAFAEKLLPLTRGLDGLILPPVMGLNKHRAVMAVLKRVLQMPVIEALADICSVPGVRLMLALEAALTAAEVRLISPIQSVTTPDRRFSHATSRDHGDIYAGACVLATGRFWTGGLKWPRGARCKESLFDLPVMTATGPLVERHAMEVTRRRPEEAHPLMTAGIGIDEQLRPLDAAGRPYLNVRAAGMVIGGFSPRDARCADGVALATAHRAAHDLLQGHSQEAR